MSQFERHFTLAEARALLPELRRAFARIHTLMGEIRRRRGEQQEAVTFFSANGHGPRVAGEESRQTAEIQAILDGIHAKGVLVKDLQRGLCDFPCFLPPDDREVFLCWELCEADIGYWHTIEGGYAARVPLEP